jgi:CRP-like cAMP-binding protein
MGREETLMVPPDAGRRSPRVSTAVAAAWHESSLGSLPPHVTEALLEDAQEVTVHAGVVFYRGAQHDETATIALVADGLVRTFLQGHNGRQVTIRYAGPGDLVGAPAVVLAGLDDAASQALWANAGGQAIHGEALRDTLVLKLSPERFTRLAKTEVSLAAAVAIELANRAVEAEQLLADGLFRSVRARVARHLMDLAVRQDDKLVVTAGHQEIADAIGSVREVVSRTLVGMREEGVVDRWGGQTVVLDPAAIHAIAAEG